VTILTVGCNILWQRQLSLVSHVTNKLSGWPSFQCNDTVGLASWNISFTNPKTFPLAVMCYPSDKPSMQKTNGASNKLSTTSHQGMGNASDLRQVEVTRLAVLLSLISSARC